MSRTLRIYLAAVAGGLFALVVFVTGGRDFVTEGHGTVTHHPFAVAALVLGLAVACAAFFALPDVRQPRSRRPANLAKPFLALAGILLVGAVFLRPRVNLDALRAAVARDLRPGTPAARIESYLDSLHIWHGWAGPAGPRPVAWSINASVEDWRRPHLISDGIFLEFRLDSAYKLISAHVDESWTMP